jgi:hypothetical protein
MTQGAQLRRLSLIAWLLCSIDQGEALCAL